MDRLTLSEARERVAAQMFAQRFLVDEIDWTQPGREALLVAGLLPRATGQGERDALQAVALALSGYRAHLDYTAGQDAMADQWSAHLRAERAERKKAARPIHWIHAGHGWHVARLGRKYIAKCRVNGLFGNHRGAAHPGSPAPPPEPCSVACRLPERTCGATSPRLA